MSQFDKREKIFEEKYRRDQEQNFKMQARCNKLLGLWAAKKLGLDAAEADAYAKEVTKSDFDEPGNGFDISEHLVRKEMDKLLQQAREELR